MAGDNLLRSAALVAVLSLCSGCSETVATEPGPLGKVDLKAHWPKSAPAPPSKLDTYTTTWSFCEAEPFPAAEAKVTWRTFRDGEAGYVVDYEVELTRPSPNLVVSLSKAGIFHGSVNLTPGDPYLGVTEVRVSCDRKAYRGLKSHEHDIGDSLQLVADGTVRD